ncbi:MAG: glycoside hydrolase family 97 protein [Bacteroidales bacterium]|nr:glycoside hydrolase family 97 protein [Bacteroidales bacterium]
MKKFIYSLFLSAVALSASAVEKQVKSPDGQIVVTVSDNGGNPAYKVTLGGVDFIESSPLGLVLDYGDFTKNMSIADSKDVKKQETYFLGNSKQSKIDVDANGGVFTFAQDGKKIYDVEFFVSNRDVVFRYTVHAQRPTFCCVVKKEATGFKFANGTTTFLCPQSGPMGGFARTSPSYETHYTVDDATGKNGWGEGYTFPCLFKNGDKGWILVSETGVNGRYCGARLMGGNGTLYNIGFPQEGEMNGLASVTPGLSLPSSTPWRTITLGKTLANIVETTAPFDYVEQLYEPSQKYQYGRGSWSWIIGMDGNTTFDMQKEYIDFSAEMKFESVLVDALWDTQIGRDKIKELADYGNSKNVALYLWYNSNGYWNDAPQGPRNVMDNIITRRREMKWMQSIGIRGIKVDFFGGDKQQMLQLYEDILADANDYGLLVIFHGCTLPRGWERMYPNFAACEAVRASENLAFGQNECDNEAFCATIHPFVRNTVGSMDWGGSTLNKHYSFDNKRGNTRKTSDVFALAVAILFQSPVQHFAMAPNNLNDAPKWAIDFMKAVPTTWDEVKFIDGYPGKYAVIARRHADKWYVTAINAQKETLKLNLTLPMFSAGETVKLYSDDANLCGSLKDVKVSKKQQVMITVPCNGGAVIVK